MTNANEICNSTDSNQSGLELAHIPRIADDFDRWIKLADHYAKRHDERRNYEWKITLGFWAAILATMHQKIVPEKIAMEYWVIAFLFFAIVWVYGTWFRNNEDMQRQFYCLDTAVGLDTEKDLDGSLRINPFTQKMSMLNPNLIYKCITSWSRIFQIGVTGGIIMLASGQSTQKFFIKLPVFYSGIWLVVGFVLGVALSVWRYRKMEISSKA